MKNIIALAVLSFLSSNLVLADSHKVSAGKFEVHVSRDNFIDYHENITCRFIQDADKNFLKLDACWKRGSIRSVLTLNALAPYYKVKTKGVLRIDLRTQAMVLGGRQIGHATSNIVTHYPITREQIAIVDEWKGNVGIQIDEDESTIEIESFDRFIPDSDPSLGSL